MWTLKHEISLPRFYELLIKIELKGDTALDLKNFYNHINMSLDAVTRLREKLLPDFLSINKNDYFKEYIVPDPNHSSYTWNLQVYKFLGQSLLVAMTNDTCVNLPWHLRPTKLSALMLMRPQDGLSSPDFSIHVPLTLEE